MCGVSCLTLPLRFASSVGVPLDVPFGLSVFPNNVAGARPVRIESHQHKQTTRTYRTHACNRLFTPHSRRGQPAPPADPHQSRPPIVALLSQVGKYISSNYHTQTSCTDKTKSCNAGHYLDYDRGYVWKATTWDDRRCVLCQEFYYTPNYDTTCRQQPTCSHGQRLHYNGNSVKNDHVNLGVCEDCPINTYVLPLKSDTITAEKQFKRWVFLLPSASPHSRPHGALSDSGQATTPA